jgi:Uma2 family endonuclease
MADVQEKLYTADDLWELSQQMDDPQYELIEGELSEMSPTGERHGDVTSELNMIVRQHVKVNKLGRVTAAETGYILYKNPDPYVKDTVLAPNVGFIAKERAAPKAAEGFVNGAPDLAIEVVPPSDRYSKIAKKVELYLRYGTRLVLIVDADEQIIVQHTSAGTKIFARDDILDFGDVLPGLNIRVRDIFEESE